MQSEPFFAAAAAGWDHDGWQGTFYPADLPREWRLTYYANEFDAVLVSAAQWSTAPDGAVAQWADDTVSAFRFFLGWHGSAVEQAALSRVVGLLCGTCGGLMAATQAQAAPAAARGSGFFFAQPPPAAALQRLESQCAGACWRLQPEGYRCTAAGLRSVHLHHGVDVRRLRGIVELLAGGGDGGVLVVDGTPPLLETLAGARTLAAPLRR